MAVDVLLAMGPWYHCAMTSTSDSELLVLAEARLREAQEIMGLPAPETAVSGDAWDDLAERAAELLKRAWELRPMNLGAKAGGKIRDAVRSGLDKASKAAKSTRDKLAKVALGAGMLALSPGVLLGLAAFLLIEGTGYGSRARRAGRRYVNRRLRAYGV
jgi:hypothetical protein